LAVFHPFAPRRSFSWGDKLLRVCTNFTQGGQHHGQRSGLPETSSWVGCKEAGWVQDRGAEGTREEERHAGGGCGWDWSHESLTLCPPHSASGLGMLGFCLPFLVMVGVRREREGAL
jgi:hypothetical protein